MGLDDQQLDFYGPDFRPAARAGQCVLLQRGRALSKLYQVAYTEPVGPLGQGGLLPIWAQAVAGGAAIDKYQTDANAATGTIGKGTSKTCKPQALNLGPNELLQFRWLVRVVGALSSGWVVDDLDVGVQSPPSSSRFGLAQANPSVAMRNAIQQLPDPNDQNLAAISGTNMALVASANTADPFEGSIAARTTLFVFGENASPQFTLYNRNTTTDMAAATMAVCLEIQGFRFELVDAVVGADWVPRSVYGTIYKLPPTQDPLLLPIIPIEPVPATS